MNFLLKHLSTLLLITLLFVACQEKPTPEPEIQKPQGNITTVQVGTPNGRTPDEPESKVAIGDIGTAMTFEWEEGDIFTVYKGDGTERYGNFICTTVDTEGYGTFVVADGENFGLVEGDEYTVVYPATDEKIISIKKRKEFMVEQIASQKTIEGDKTGYAHLDNYLFMNASFTAKNEMSINFKYEVSTFVLRYMWSANLDVTEAKLTDNETINAVTNTEGFPIDEHYMVTAYFMTLPQATTTEDRTLTFNMSNNHNSKDYSYKSKAGYSSGRTFRVTVTSFPPEDYIDSNGDNHGEGTKVKGVIWAPVNLGYDKDDYPYGKLYQWGRVDGQGYYGKGYVNYQGKEMTFKDATYPSEENGKIIDMGGCDGLKIEDTPIEDCFYKNQNNNRNWSQRDFAGGDMNYWLDSYPNDHGKKIGNPCPDGWRIPTYEELLSLMGGGGNWDPGDPKTKDEQPGYYFNGTKTKDLTEGVFLPLSGLRDTGGAARDRQNQGYYWCSETTANDGNEHKSAYALFIIQRQVNVSSYKSRANGLSIRCVQD